MDINKFHDFYRIESTRLKNWDYSKQGWYFITICVKDKKWDFGKIVDDEMKLSKIGEIAKNCWEEFPKHFENVTMREFVMMPNHMHGVVDVVNENYKSAHVINPGIINDSHVETRNCASLHKITTRGENFYQTISKKSNQVIPNILRTYKAAVKQFANANKIDFSWQPRFYDVIIRDEMQLYFVEEYIKNNPKNWKKDPMNKNVKDVDWDKVAIVLR